MSDYYAESIRNSVEDVLRNLPTLNANAEAVEALVERIDPANVTEAAAQAALEAAQRLHEMAEEILDRVGFLVDEVRERDAQ